MRDNLRRVGRMIRAAEQAGPGAAEVVQTVTSPAAGWVQVDSAGATYPARVPGSLRKTVTAGQTVGQGYHIAAVGSTGNSSGNHCHLEITVNGALVKLTAYQYKVLDYLMHHAGRIVSRTELTEKIYSQDHERDSNTIEVFIGILRRKIGTDRIITEKGLGYRLIDPAEPFLSRVISGTAPR